MRHTAILAVLLVTPACSSSSNEDSTTPSGPTPTCTVGTVDAGFSSLSQVCSTASDPGNLQQDPCGPYVIVTHGLDTTDSWYFDAQTGALVAVVTAGACVTSSSTFASEWGVQAWGCATATPLCTADGGAPEASHD